MLQLNIKNFNPLKQLASLYKNIHEEYKKNST